MDDIDAALTVATSHGSRLVDVGRLTLLDDEAADHGHAFLIIAGIGFDAVMIDDTDPELKKNISWLAYFVSGVKNLFAPKYKGDVTITSADGSTHTTHGLTFPHVHASGNCAVRIFHHARRRVPMTAFSITRSLTSGGLIGWRICSAMCHRTITGKAQQYRCPRIPRLTRFRASARKSSWRSPCWLRWMATCFPKRSTFVSVWSVSRCACACRKRRSHPNTRQ